MNLTLTSAFLLSRVLAAAIKNTSKNDMSEVEKSSNSSKLPIAFSLLHNICCVFNLDCGSYSHLIL